MSDIENINKTQTKKRGRPPKILNSSDAESGNSDVNNNINNELTKKRRKSKYSSDEERYQMRKKQMNERNKQLYRENEEYRNKQLSQYKKKDILDYNLGRPKIIQETETELKDKLLKKLKNNILQIMRLNKKSDIVDELVISNIKNIYEII